MKPFQFKMNLRIHVHVVSVVHLVCEKSDDSCHTRKNLPTVENLTAKGVFLPTNSNGFSFVYLVTSCVHSKYPKAPENIEVTAGACD